jgi:predicted metal-dependent phosphoesterase TrpH
MKFDLHMHSVYSDGDLLPEALALIANEQSLDMVALTDHDSMAGYLPFLKALQPYNIRLIPGVEWSVSWQQQEIHVLGLGFDPHSLNLQRYLDVQFQRRFARALKIAQSLTAMGFKDNFRAVVEVAGHHHLSRTHFAKYLVDICGVKDYKAAFRDYLGRHAKAYVPSRWGGIAETVDVIHAAGGYAILAHPLHYRLTTAQLKGLFRDFKQQGGDGIELISAYQSAKDGHRLLQLAKPFNFLYSSGSDFHRTQAFRPTLGGQSTLDAEIEWIWQVL